MKKIWTILISTSVLFLFVGLSLPVSQPELGTRSAKLLHEGELKFRDLNKNGKLDPYEDWRLPDEERISNLVGMMTLEEKVGLMFHPNFAVTPDGAVKYEMTRKERRSLEGTGYSSLPGQMLATATAKSFIEDKNFRCILNNGIAEPKLFAQWSNRMQEIAEKSRLGIPIMFSTDPRHGANQGGHITGKQYFSQWPSVEGQYGITASRDKELMESYGEVTAEEYRAVGLHMILGPQIDVTTEPRWKRNFGSFSESAELTSEMLDAYMDGAQGTDVGPEKILVMLKHWPGSGPHAGGTGNWIIYPGDNLYYHLIPWETGFDKGALAVMGYYSGTYFDTLAVNFSKYLSTDVLRGRLGFDGVLCSDWYAISRRGALHPLLVGNPLIDRFEMSVNAGVDQFGGEASPEIILELVKEGKISEERINLAASRVLRWHFKLGLFENPYVDVHAAAEIVNSEKNRQLGYKAQQESVVMLTNNGFLPVSFGADAPDIYVFGIDSAVASQYGRVVGNPAEADLAILKVSSTGSDVPGASVQNSSGEVDISFPQKTMEMIGSVASSGTPTVVAVNLSGALTVLPKELQEIAAATFMVFDITDNPIMEAIFGKFNPSGKLPFELPSSMDAVREQLEDVPFDSKDPLFGYGHGLSY